MRRPSPVTLIVALVVEAPLPSILIRALYVLPAPAFLIRYQYESMESSPGSSQLKETELPANDALNLDGASGTSVEATA